VRFVAAVLAANVRGSLTIFTRSCPAEALQQKLDASGVRYRNLEAELEEQDEKMRQMQVRG
jgi:hypothetical protein